MYLCNCPRQRPSGSRKPSSLLTNEGVCLNGHVKCEKQRYQSNVGYFSVEIFGDITGTTLRFADVARLEEQYQRRKIDGNIPHWQNPRDAIPKAHSIIGHTRDRQENEDQHGSI